MVRKLNIPNQGAAKPEGGTTPQVKRLKISTPAPTPTPAVAPKPAVKSLGIAPVKYVPPQKVVKRTKTDDLIDEAVKLDPTIDPIRIRARIDTLLTASVTRILDYAENSLKTLRAASSLQSEIVSRMAQINASQWLKETLEDSTKKPSIWTALAPKKTPDFYEGKLNQIRAELKALVERADTIADNYAPDVRDLQLDTIAMLVAAPHMEDAHIAGNRAKSLQASHLTGAMLLETIKNMKIQSADFMQQIDDLMNVTIPNWKMAYGK